MIIGCSSCQTRYNIDQTKLGSGGRTVRCARCGHQWHQKPEITATLAEMTEPPARPVKTPSSRFVGEPPKTATAAAASEAPEPAWPRRANVPALPKKRFSFAQISLTSGMKGWAGLAATVAFVVVVMWAGQSYIAAAWPPAARLYSIVGLGEADVQPGAGLEMPALTPRIEVEAGTPVLVLEGMVINKSDRAVAVPALIANLRDDRNEVVETWTFRMDVERLAAGASASFRTRKERPPERARHVEVVFTGAPVN